MKNFIQNGGHLTIPAPHDLRSGELVLVGDLVGVACLDAAKTQGVTLALEGVYTLPKEKAEGIALGHRLYTKGGSVTTKAEGGVYVGIAVAAADQTATSVAVRLR